MNEFKEAALKYAKMGLAVFPLAERDKHPLTANGFKNATTDPAKINEWWTIHPDANIGIATAMTSITFSQFLERAVKSSATVFSPEPTALSAISPYMMSRESRRFLYLAARDSEIFSCIL